MSDDLRNDIANDPLQEALDEVPWQVPTSAPDDPVEIISEWMERHLIDDVAEGVGVAKEGSTAAAACYARCAWEEIKARGLS